MRVFLLGMGWTGKPHGRTDRRMYSEESKVWSEGSEDGREDGVGGTTQSVYFSLGICMAPLKPGSRQASAQAQLPWGYFWEACRLRLPPLPLFIAFPLLKSSSDVIEKERSAADPGVILSFSEESALASDKSWPEHPLSLQTWALGRSPKLSAVSFSFMEWRYTTTVLRRLTLSAIT